MISCLSEREFYVGGDSFVQEHFILHHAHRGGHKAYFGRDARHDGKDQSAGGAGHPVACHRLFWLCAGCQKAGLLHQALGGGGLPRGGGSGCHYLDGRAALLCGGHLADRDAHHRLGAQRSG